MNTKVDMRSLADLEWERFQADPRGYVLAPSNSMAEHGLDFNQSRRLPKIIRDVHAVPAGVSLGWSRSLGGQVDVGARSDQIVTEVSTYYIAKVGESASIAEKIISPLVDAHRLDSDIKVLTVQLREDTLSAAEHIITAIGGKVL